MLASAKSFHQTAPSPQAETLPVSGLTRIAARAVGHDEWDRVVSGFDTVCQEQIHGFAALRWPGVALEPRLFESDGKVVGGALMMIQRLPLGVSSIAISKWAPMLADSGHPRASALYDGMIDALVAEYARERGMTLSIMAHASPENLNVEYLALKAKGFRRGTSIPFPDRYLVRLGLSDEDQRRSFGQTWRRQLGKAEKAGLSFERAGAGQIDVFKTLYAAMTDRKQFPDHSAYDTLDRLMALDEPLRPELFFVRHEGRVVAGAVIFKAGERAAYLYGATNDEALPLRAGYFLHWHIIGWLRDHTRARWYDLGGTDGYSGLHQFKKGMVGDAGAIRQLPPTLNYAANPVAYGLGAGALLARETLLEVRRWIDAKRPSGAAPDMPRPVLERYMQ